MDVHHALDEMDKKVHLEREEMDKKLSKERAAVDRVIKHEREKMDLKMKHMDAETDKKLMLERQEMDIKVKQERAALDEALKLDREKMVKEIRKIRKNMDQKLRQVWDEMDHTVQLERAKMDSKNMQARADIDQKLQHDRKEMDSQFLLEQVRMETKMMQDRARIAPKATTDQIQLHIPPPEEPVSYFLQGLVMEFSVTVDGEISYSPKGYFGGRTGYMIVREPDVVEWSLMVNHLRVHGYKGDADLYYLEPGCIPPDGMVLMSGPEHVEQMMQAHKGKKKCHLYIVRNGSQSDGCDDGMNEKGQFDHFTSWEPIDRWDEGHTHEHGSSPLTEQPASSSRKKALTFSSGEEDMDAECAPH